MIRWRAAVSTWCAALAWLLAGAPPAAALAWPKPDLTFTMRDGFTLPARLWLPTHGTQHAGVILALHGFTDSRDAWAYPAPVFAAAGYVVVAPDQRGFGATADRGTWPGQAVLEGDAEELAAQLRTRYPGQRLVLMGESMGGAIALCVAASAPRTADAYVLVSPAVWGRAQMPLSLRASLWAANLVAPNWRLTGNEIPLDLAATDNWEALHQLASNPLTLKGANVGMLHGLVDAMTSAQAAAPNLPANVLILNGRRDQIVPQPAIAALWAKLPHGVRRAFYLNGFHMLLRDLGRALVEADIVAWLAAPQAWLPSGADINAAAWQSDHAWSGDVPLALPAAAMDGIGKRPIWPY